MKNDESNDRHLVEMPGQPGQTLEEVPFRRHVARVRLDEATAQELWLVLREEHTRRLVALHTARAEGVEPEHQARLKRDKRLIERLLNETRRTIGEMGWNE